MSLFITVEGPDGGGKSTQIRRLANRLTQLGIGSVITREPGGTLISNKIRTVLLDPDNKDMTPKTEALLYAASRAQHVAEVIRPALADGKIVLCDRYIDASLAYQASGLGLSSEYVRSLSENATDGLWPIRTYLIDVPAEVGLKRVASTRSLALDRIEQRELTYHIQVRAKFLQLAEEEPNRFYVVDGTRTVDEITMEIWEDLIQLVRT